MVLSEKHGKSGSFLIYGTSKDGSTDSRSIPMERSEAPQEMHMLPLLYTPFLLLHFEIGSVRFYSVIVRRMQSIYPLFADLGLIHTISLPQ